MDISKELIVKVKETFEEKLANSKRAKSITEKIENGGSYGYVNEYAFLLSGLLTEAITETISKDDLPNGEFYQNIGDKVIEPMLKECYTLISEECSLIDKWTNKKLGMNINSVMADYDIYNSYDVVNSIRNNYDEKVLQENIQTANYKVVDNFIKENAKFKVESGLEARVTRTYDGVGLHKGKDACQWCIAREGTDIPYTQALAMGMFERHNGCGCEIEYTSARGVTTYQNGKGGRGSWHNEEERSQRIANSKSTVLKEIETNYGVSVRDVSKEFYNYATPGRGTIDYDKGYKRKDRAEEIEIAKILHKKLGGDILLRAERANQKNADYFWLEELWELKSPSSAKSIDGLIKKSLLQIESLPGGLIIDISKIKITDEELANKLAYRISRSGYRLAPIDVIVIKNNDIDTIYRIDK